MSKSCGPAIHVWHFKDDFPVEIHARKNGISFLTDICNDVKDTTKDVKKPEAGNARGAQLEKKGDRGEEKAVRIM